MGHVIWKFPIDTKDRTTIEINKGALILSLQVQYGEPYIWAMCDMDAEAEERTFRIFGTGHPFQQNEGESLQFIGTYQLRGGALVFHLFEVVEVLPTLESRVEKIECELVEIGEHIS